MYPFGDNFNPFSEQSDRRSQVGMAISDVWQESETGIRHFTKTHQLTGEQWNCMTDASGNLIAEYTLQRTYPRLTLIKRRHNDGRELSRETYGLGQGTTIPSRTSHVDLTKFVRTGVDSGRVKLLSGSGEPKEDEDGNLVIESWEYIHGADEGPLGKMRKTEVFAKDGTPIARTVGKKRTSFADGPLAVPLETLDVRTGQRTEVMSSRFISSDGITETKIPVTEEAKVLDSWKQLITRLFGRFR
jgi:hypothetical protein